jgi:hypothetical protein
MSGVDLPRTKKAVDRPLATDLARLVEQLFEIRSQSEKVAMNGSDRLDVRSNLLCAVKSLYRATQIINDAEEAA